MPPASPAFTVEYSRAWVYYALRGARRAGGVDKRIAWIPPPGDTPPVALTLAETWARRGVYLFLGRASRDDGRLLSRCRSWLATAATADVQLAWIADPDEAAEAWRPASVRVSALTDTGGTLAAGARLPLRNYAIVLSRGCRIGIDSDATRIVLATPDDAPPMALFDVEGRGSIPLDPPVVTVELQGAEAGTLRVALRSAATAAGPALPLDILDVGCRYFYPAPGRAGAGGALSSLACPIFAPGTDLRLAGTLDLHAPLDATTRLAIDPGGAAAPSHFRTTLGAPIALQPLEGAALRFAPAPASRHAPADGPLYLTIAGPFGLRAAAGGVFEGALLCGTSGAEYVEVAGQEATLTFVPGQPAYAPLFDPHPGDDDGEFVDAPRLDGLATTSWVALTAATSLRYFAQPAGGAFHARTAPPAGGGDTIGLLSFLPVPAAHLPDASAPPWAVPMVPYAGVPAASVATARGFEADVLCQERRQAIHTLGRARKGPPAPVRTRRLQSDDRLTAMTPDGFLATFNADCTQWESLVFARCGEDRLAFDRLDDPLRAGLLTSRPFLVISDPAALAAHFAGHNRIVVAGWPFDLDPARWTRHGTMAIVKRCDTALGDLVQDVGTWTLPEAFNLDPARTQEDLLALLEDARARGADSPGHAHFIRAVVDDPHWNGVLFLRCCVPPDGLPPDLRDLAPGLDPDRFLAHHLGITQTPVTASLEGGDSALFGLIAYDAPLRRQTATGARYDFQVLELRVQLTGAAVRDFSATIAVTLGRLFGAEATMAGSNAPPVLRLSGSRQRQDDRDIYVFRNTAGARFDVRDRVLHQVDVARAEFASVTTPASDGDVVSRISFSGALAFRPLKARDDQVLDLIGYDALPFSGLVLEMRFPPGRPAAVSFTFDASGMVFDGTDAATRAHSLPRHFPIEPLRAISSAVADRPASLGFMAVRVPGLDTPPLGSEWYGIVCDLDLGTPGALASQAGFTAQLALVWSPSPVTQSCVVGLALPGAGGASRQLSLMGVLTLSIHQMQLLHADNAFLLQLTGITLTLLGKALPPGGTFDFFVFGDPADRTGPPSLGWYGAFRTPRADTGDGGEDRGLLALGTPDAHGWARALTAATTGTGRDRTRARVDRTGRIGHSRHGSRRDGWRDDDR